MEATDPFALFNQWYTEARESEINDSNAMALATASADGQPDVRMVLLKGHGPDGFIFYTNDESNKGRQIAENPKASLLFHWKSLRRQIRIAGSISPVTSATANAYFATRSRDSQLGAWASDQSRPLESRAVFEARFAEVQSRFEGQDVPRPPRWNGHLVSPSRIEFWSDGAHRMHHRRVFTATPDGWTEGLLYP